ncbi:orotate phosphoribosyltransferase [candidate division LCP-89 bacterium B3_LCP]|uniref:Orotate phosphoribosyltransferase n=1 Tax=candidate division LCP-89 bacterium B3_LCP TaxID=2012998 RepID=A0A532V5K4_UNCL8|nr:MAG: orotate phosphoribosyltransferase [candidate division LCP-89 bacterium B3_LCP]
MIEPISPQRVQELLKKCGAYLEGHFELRSGKHSGQYVEKFRLLERPEIAGELCSAMADAFRDRNVERVAGPALGGVVIAYEVARSLNVPCAFAERVGDKLEFRRGFAFQPGERVLVVEDIVTTGGSARQVVEAVREAGADPIGAAVLVNRSGKPLELGTEAIALLEMNIATYDPADCPLCRDNVALIAPGSKGIKGK